MQLTLTIPVLCAIPLAPLFGSMIAGFFGTKLGGNRIGHGACQFVTILGVAPR
jgi:NADH-quinone oxidoreductase subunit L